MLNGRSLFDRLKNDRPLIGESAIAPLIDEKTIALQLNQERSHSKTIKSKACLSKLEVIT
jgi:hypothetical protein